MLKMGSTLVNNWHFTTNMTQVVGTNDFKGYSAYGSKEELKWSAYVYILNLKRPIWLDNRNKRFNK